MCTNIIISEIGVRNPRATGHLNICDDTDGWKDEMFYLNKFIVESFYDLEYDDLGVDGVDTLP